jgi:FtsH-binding integral membrane protein
LSRVTEIAEQRSPIWWMINTLRAAGWYLMAPFLLYGFWQALKARERRAQLIWLAVWTALWVVIASINGGADDWDNPRYRLIFFGVQVVVAAYAWTAWQARRDAWLPRIVGLEILCVLVFGQWYVARYYLVGIHLPIMVVLALSLTIAGLILLGGWLWDSFRARRGRAHSGHRV